MTQVPGALPHLFRVKLECGLVTSIGSNPFIKQHSLGKNWKRPACKGHKLRVLFLVGRCLPIHPLLLGRVQRERVCPDGAPGVVPDGLLEHLHDYIRAPVHDQVLVLELRVRAHDPKHTSLFSRGRAPSRRGTPRE